MIRLHYLLPALAALIGSIAQAQLRTNPPLGESVERHLSPDEPRTQWVSDPDYVDVERGDVLATREVETEELETIKLANIVPPIHFESGVAEIPHSTIEELRSILARMQDRRNVRLHLVGHADDQPLSDALAAVFGDNEGLSRERAGEVAELFQVGLGLPPEAVSYAWAGDSQPIAANETAAGRALNRRVEVEVWYDEVRDAVALEEFLVPQEISRIKVCRMETVCKLTYLEGHAHRARVQNLIPPLHYETETIDVSSEFVTRIRQALDNLADKQNVVVKFVGYTDNQPLTSRDERIYGTHAGLSSARARRVALSIQDGLGLPTAAIDSDGRGTERPLGSNDTAQGRRLNRRVEVEFWYDDPLQELPDEPQLCPADPGASLVSKVYDPPWGGIEPVRLEQGQPVVPSGLTASLERAMTDVADKTNVRLRFVGFTGNERLDRRTALVYGDDIGLSAARARRAMEIVGGEMQLTAAQLEFEGHGFVQSSDVVNAGFTQGQDSFVEVQVVYDDLALLDDYAGVDITRLTRELAPENPFALNMMRITVDGKPIDDPDRSSADIQRCTDVALQEANIQFAFDNLRADPRLSVSAYPVTLALRDIDLDTEADTDAVVDAAAADTQAGGDVGLEEAGDVAATSTVEMPSEDRGEVAGEYVPAMAETAATVEAEQMVVAAAAASEDAAAEAGGDVAASVVAVVAVAAMETAAGEAEDADLAAANALLAAHPEAEPATGSEADAGADAAPRRSAATVHFRMYSNYSHYIERTEIRIFDADQSLRATPLDIVEVGADGMAAWQPAAERFRAPVRELKFVLRAYGHEGNFDETTPQPLWLTYGIDAEAEPEEAEEETDVVGAPAASGSSPETASFWRTEPLTWPTSPDAGALGGAASLGATAAFGGDDAAGGGAVAAGAATAGGKTPLPSGELLADYGENDLALHNITLSSGTVTVRGSGIPPGRTVLVGGQPTPVDARGNFVTETILPTGLHTVEVAVLDPDGSGELYLRDLELERNDWFYVGMADITLSADSTDGPAELLQGENSSFDFDENSTGRLAFFVNGKFGEQWRLAASADTQEEPLEDLFSNFTSKSPDSLFRRLDPDYYYPTFGDDSTVEELTPTMGRFFVKLSQGETYGMWGNFRAGYMNNELAQVDRGLYGGNFHYQSSSTTSFGEQRLALDTFTAEPGTVPSWEEFRGTGGSLYFLRRQDILGGSERIRIEVRDKASGIVTGVVNLRPALDYDIDYLQGRILLAEPLSSTVDDGLLVRSNAIQGDEAYLVVRYEYTPGFEEIDSMSLGGQVHYWFNDYVKLGLTANSNEQGVVDSNLSATDLTIRKSAQTWMKIQTGQSEGLISNGVRSNDGGYGFSGYDDLSFAGTSAGAQRLDFSFGFDDFFDRARGRATLYGQELEAGYSAPGLATLTDTRHYGGSFSMPIGDSLRIGAKSDARIQELGIETQAHEIDVGYQLNDRWDLSMGVRKDERIDNSLVIPLTQQQGERTDAVVQIGYDSRGQWSAYGFLQDTVSITGGREENGRVGMGGKYQITERLGLELELSDGDLGAGGKVGTNYIHSDRTSFYLNYALENERTDNGLRANRGSEGNLVAGAKTRLSDSASIYVEERYQQNDYMTGLTHATGVSLAPAERWNIGANTDIGTLRDVVTGAETKRAAAGFQIGYGFDAAQISTGVELRQDETQQPDLAIATRETWLFRNSFKYQFTPAMRLLGKLNHSESESTQGQFYDGGFTEAVVGFAYRPVRNDRFNALAKYTYFYNVPTAGQITLQNTAAEFIQKSQIASFDFDYDIRPQWSIGGKYAYRRSQVSLDRENPLFFDNGAQLYIIRADWEFRKDWEALFETRLLDLSDIGEKRSGALVVVSRYFGPHFKLGVGYNFTDFSDDLTDLSFDHEGVFINLTGAL